MTWKILTYELRILIAERLVIPVALLFVIATAYGLFNGYSRVREQQRKVTASVANQVELYQAKQKEAETTERKQAEKADTNQAPGLPAASVRADLLNFRAALPSGSGALFANGQSDLLPQSYAYRKFNDDSPSVPTVAGRSQSNLFPESVSANPLRLLTGSFDLSFAVLYLFPLLSIALCYNLVVMDREIGTLALALSQPISWQAFLHGKLFARALLIGICAVLLPTLVVGVLQKHLFGEVDVIRLIWWGLAVTVYVAFWFGLSLLVGHFSVSAARAALTLIISWIVFVALLPAIATFTADLFFPLEPGITFAEKERAVRTEALAKAAQLQTQRG